MSRFPLAREGELSKLRAAVVDEPGLAAMGRALELGELLRLGRGEELTGGREKASLLADAMEAVIAAVFLDGGLAAVLRLDRPLPRGGLRPGRPAARSTATSRPSSRSWPRPASAPRPRYRVVAELGPDHAKTFEVEVELRGEVLGRGSGRSKKDAEQAAARVALEALAALPPEPVAAAHRRRCPSPRRPPRPPPRRRARHRERGRPSRKARKAKAQEALRRPRRPGRPRPADEEDCGQAGA